MNEEGLLGRGDGKWKWDRDGRWAQEESDRKRKVWQPESKSWETKGQERREGECGGAETDSGCDCCWAEEPYRPLRTSPPNVSQVRTTPGSQQDPLGPPGKQIITDISASATHTHTSTALPPLALYVPGATTSGRAALPGLNLLTHLHGVTDVTTAANVGTTFPSKIKKKLFVFSPDKLRHGW